MTKKRLVVLLEGQVAGDLTETDGQLTFTYDDAYREQPDPTPLSLSVPIAVKHHSGVHVKNFLWGLLPDNARVLERWAVRFETTAGSVFGLISGVGEDCAGAVQFVRAERLSELSAETPPLPADEAWIAGRLREVRRDAAAWHATSGARSEGNWSLAGAQPKFALAWDQDRWVRPTGTSATTHIFKPNTSGFVHFDVNEFLCLATARQLGLPAAFAEVREFEDERVLVVQRYDRTDTNTRIHQEDLCQAMGVHPERKYQNDMGPSVESVRTRLDERLDSDQSDLVADQFMRSLAFHWLVLNTDGHAKNFSLLLAGSMVRLAPLYDVASACIYQRTTPGNPELGELRSSGLRLALSIGGEYEANKTKDANWRTCARHLRLDEERVATTVREMAEGLPAAMEAASAQLPEGLADDFADRFVELVVQRSTRCTQLLDTKTARSRR